MATLRITKIFELEMAHALWGYEGPCKNIHGHSYKLWVTVSGKITDGSSRPKNSMVMDFSEIKKIVTEKIIFPFDHSLLLDSGIPEKLKRTAEKLSGKIIFTNGMPTCEMIVCIFAGILQKSFPPEIMLHHLKLQETSTSFAEWFYADNR